ncbi:Alpha/Beta hydrolase protein [Crucibulum laeve]|uniref:Alpha/Beta hydrolase protein n=1 Tax=Crucibulum laeve TaxID=68775 RepID=A0A5C3LPP7_9AGAR|nr:Alpha/Beta hydrolase protein [Crucibulum laeve]
MEHAGYKFKTLEYKSLQDGQWISLDLYPPTVSRRQQIEQVDGNVHIASIPAVIYFHGGGLTVGNRKSWFPTWLQSRVSSMGFAFISADYRLIPPSTAHSIVEDIQDLFTFLPTLNSPFLTEKGLESHTHSFNIDMDAIAVSGSSAGGLCAYLAAMHCTSPKPKAVLSMYGMGGEFMTAHYLKPKTEVFFRGRELLDSCDFAEFVYPFSSPSGSSQEISDSPLAYHPLTYHIPGYPANPRMLLARLYLQRGDFLDYYTGEYEPSLSSRLRSIWELEIHDVVKQNLSHVSGSELDSSGARMKLIIPEQYLPLFPQFGVTSAWPATILIHGSADTAVPIHESRNMARLLEEAGVPVKLLVFDGKEHSFDYEPDAMIAHGKEFDEAVELLKRLLRPSLAGVRDSE